MLEIVPYKLSEIKNKLKRKAIEEFGLIDAEFEGSNISQLINLLAYSTVINNTNFTFGLNEMFITQAKDRRNVIKHARQMGYSHKRKVSFQYKTKLRVLKSGQVTLSKYSNFSSNGNNYVYFGESITDIYGTYAYLKLLTNEYNNSIIDVYSGTSTNLEPGKFIITEEGVVSKILRKDTVGEPRLLLEVLDSSTLPVMSQLPQEVYVHDGTYTSGYRNFTKIGTIDTFITDTATKTFKIQITLEDGVIFPISTSIVHTILDSNNLPIDVTVVNTNTTGGGNSDFTLSEDTEFPINSIESLVLSRTGEPDINVSLSTITISNNERNIIIPGDRLDAIEDYTGTDIILVDLITYQSSITTRNNMIPNSLRELRVNINNKTYTYTLPDLSITGNTINIPPVEDKATDSGLDINTNGIIILSKDTAKVVDTVIVTDANGNRTNIIDSFFSYTSTGVQLLEYDAVGGYQPTSAYDVGYTAEVTYTYYVKTNLSVITVDYSYIKDIAGYTAVMNYNYIKDNDGYLNKRIFFSDFRGENQNNETPYHPTANPEGWGGFYASDFNSETNVLHFDISDLTQAEIQDTNIINRTQGAKFHNPYVSVQGESPKRMQDVITTPFKKTRFSFSSEIIDPQTQEVIGYTPYDKNTTFASINSVSVKNEIEIIVKEGTIRRWNEETEQSIIDRAEAQAQNIPLPEPVYKYPELTININQDMVEAGYFTIQNNDIENTGIELYVTRVLEDGSVEYDIPWTRRDYLLAKETEVGAQSFVAMTDTDYEDYINIYTKYAGTGTPLSLDMIVKMNILTSKGSRGSTNSLMKPIDNPDFEEMYFIEETLTPVVLHIEGTEIEDTESIRNTAPLFSNTANRAVTKKDYKTICEAQPFIQNAQVWGGEEETPDKIPGNIFFSLIPYSKPINYNKVGAKYTLSDITQSALFFPSYYQITGRERYDLPRNKSDENVLFNLLDNYKIITLKLNYVKAIYMDYKVKARILKYKFGQTVEETNDEVFEAVRKYMVREVEKFDTVFYKSSLCRSIDEKLGDDYGITLDVEFSVDLYDDLLYPDEGCFYNASKTDLTPNSDGVIGYSDDWKFKMPIATPIEDLFEESIIENNIVVRPGRLITSNITNCNTRGFIVPDDMLFMELSDGTFVSLDSNGNIENVYANTYSEVIEIPIMYTRNYALSKSVDEGVVLTKAQEIQDSQRFKVGSYFIHKTQNIIRLELNTHSFKNIDEQEVVTQTMVDEQTARLRHNANNPGFELPNIYEGGAVNSLNVPDPQLDLGKPIFYEVDPLTGSYILDSNNNKIMTLLTEQVSNSNYQNVKMLYPETLPSVVLTDGIGADPGTELYSVITCALPRKYFIDKTRVLNINPKNDNIKSIKNVFSRFKSIEFL